MVLKNIANQIYLKTAKAIAGNVTAGMFPLATGDIGIGQGRVEFESIADVKTLLGITPGGGGGAAGSGAGRPGALVRLAADRPSLAANGSAVIPWATAVYDSGGFFPAVGTNFVIPAGVKFVRAFSNGQSNNVGGLFRLETLKNGVLIDPGLGSIGIEAAGSDFTFCSTAIIPVVAGNTLAVQLVNGSAARVLRNTARTWFCIEDCTPRAGTELADHTFSGETSFDVDCTGYDQVEITHTKMGFAPTGSLRVRTSSDGFVADLGDAANGYVFTGLSDSTNIGGTTPWLPIGAVNGTANRHGVATISNMKSSAFRTQSRSHASGEGNNEGLTWLSFRETAQVDTHLRFLSNAGAGSTITAGRLRVVGVA